MDEMIAVSYVMGERETVTEKDLKEMGLEDFFLMLKNHKAILTMEGADYLLSGFTTEELEDASEATDFLDADSFKEDLYGYAEMDPSEVRVLTVQDIRNVLSGKDKNDSFVAENYFLETDILIISDVEFGKILDEILADPEAKDYKMLDRYWTDDFFLVTDFEAPFEKEDYTIHDVLETFRNDTADSLTKFRNLKECYLTFMREKNEPLMERTVPDDVMVRILSSFEERKNTLTEEERRCYVSFLSLLVSHHHPGGLHMAAYAYYGGNGIVGEDYSISEACLLELLQLRYEPSYANTLGYIYYYGRTNGGVPQYDLAFKYYTMASLTGEVEARYKLGDMYRNGYYVEKNLEVARRTYDSLRGDAMHEFLKDPETASFADVFFRVGLMHEDSPELFDIWDSAEAYLMALCAIKIRNGKFDAGVRKSITNKLLTLYKNHKKEILEIHPLYNGIRQMKNIHVHVDDAAPGNVMVTFKNDRKVLIPDYYGMNCIYSDEVQVHFDGEILTPIAEDAPIEQLYEDEDDDYVFYSDGVLVGKISKSKPRLIIDSVLVEDSYDDKEYRVAVCQYQKGMGKKYTFLFEGEENPDGEWIITENGKEIYPLEFKTMKGFELPVSVSQLKHIKIKK